MQEENSKPFHNTKRQFVKTDSPHGVRAHRRRWTVFALVTVSCMLAFFQRVAPATIASDLQQTFHARAAVRVARVSKQRYKG